MTEFIKIKTKEVGKSMCKAEVQTGADTFALTLVSALTGGPEGGTCNLGSVARLSPGLTVDSFSVPQFLHL